MGGVDDFNDRHIQIEAENEPYNQYEYQLENNASWAGALPVKQLVDSKPNSSWPWWLTQHDRGLYDPSLEKDACGVGFAW
jgi:glutamate synthase (NADH)